RPLGYAFSRACLTTPTWRPRSRRRRGCSRATWSAGHRPPSWSTAIARRTRKCWRSTVGRRSPDRQAPKGASSWCTARAWRRGRRVGSAAALAPRQKNCCPCPSAPWRAGAAVGERLPERLGTFQEGTAYRARERRRGCHGGAVVLVTPGAVVVVGPMVAVVLVTVRTVVVVLLAGAPHASQQLGADPTNAVPPRGGLQAPALRLIEQVVLPVASVRQQVTAPGMPQVDCDA